MGYSQTVSALSSGSHFYARPSKLIYTAFLDHVKEDYEVNTISQCKFDTRADIICADLNFRLLSYTGQKCIVSGFLHSFKSLKGVPLAQVATAIATDNGEVIILVRNEVFYFRSQMDHP